MVESTLTWAEVAVGAHAGALRQIDNLRKGRRDAHGFQGDGWGANIDGALAEMAVAKALNRYWLPVTEGDLNDLPGDVGKIQVRSTQHNHGRLILHPTDPDDAPFILARGPLVTEDGLRFTLVGWLRGHEGKRPDWWSDPGGNGRPAFFVPNEALRALPA